MTKAKKVQTYNAYLWRDEQLIDQTNIDENSIELAEYLFYGEFKHKRTDKDYIVLEKGEKEEVE